MSAARGLGSYRISSAILLDSNPPLRRLLYTFTALSGFVAIQIMHLALHDLKLNIAMTDELIPGDVTLEGWCDDSFFLEKSIQHEGFSELHLVRQ